MQITLFKTRTWPSGSFGLIITIAAVAVVLTACIRSLRGMIDDQLLETYDRFGDLQLKND